MGASRLRVNWLQTVSDQWRRTVIWRRILLNGGCGFSNRLFELATFSKDLFAPCIVQSGDEMLAWTSFEGVEMNCMSLFIRSSILSMLEHGSKGEYVGGLARPSCPECRALKLAGWLCWARTSCAQSMTLGSHSVVRIARASQRTSERRITRWVSAGRSSVG